MSAVAKYLRGTLKRTREEYDDEADGENGAPGLKYKCTPYDTGLCVFWVLHVLLGNLEVTRVLTEAEYNEYITDSAELYAFNGVAPSHIRPMHGNVTGHPPNRRFNLSAQLYMTVRVHSLYLSNAVRGNGETFVFGSQQFTRDHVVAIVTAVSYSAAADY